MSASPRSCPGALLHALDRASLQSTDIAEGLDSTLVMLEHKLGRGVVVERDYTPEVPRIEAMAAELNQVWTNLVDNAVDAMNGRGTLRLRTRLDDLGWVVMEVEDSGPGMSGKASPRQLTTPSVVAVSTADQQQQLSTASVVADLGRRGTYVEPERQQVHGQRHRPGGVRVA